MTTSHHQEWTDQLSDYIAEELDETTRARVAEHLAGCAPCRDVAAELRDVVALARGAAELEPTRDLWPEIAAGLRSGARTGSPADEDVIALPTARTRPVGFTMSRSGLAAAAAALVLASAGTTWWVASGTAARAAAGQAESGEPVGAFAADAGEQVVPDDLAAELALLEDVLTTAQSTLDPATVAVLERNLQTIETAIADSRQALATDPGNAFLREHIERMYRRKAIYLRDAVRVVEWTG